MKAFKVVDLRLGEERQRVSKHFITADAENKQPA